MKPALKENLAPLLERLRLYNQAQRLMILAALCAQPRSVSEIERETGIGQPALSQQLGELRRAGLISARREAREVVYDFASPGEKFRAEIILSLLKGGSDSLGQVAMSPGHVGAQFASIISD